MGGDKDCQAILCQDEVLGILARDLSCRDFKLIKYNVQPFSENPMGFLGIHYKLTVNFTFEGEERTHSYFTKKVPEDIPSHNEYANATRAFYKEIEFYQQVVEDVEKNMKSERTLTKWCPRFFHARGTDLMVVEDLCAQGYYMYPERKEMDFDHISAVVKALAAMHAGPMIVEQMLRDGKLKKIPSKWTAGQPADLAHMYPQMLFETECSGDPNHAGNQFYEAGFKSQVAIVDLLTHYTKEQRANIREKLPDVLRRIFRFVNPSEKFRNTWVHGDLWANNAMFRDDINGKVDNAVIIDFQLARLCPPALDVIMFIHLVQSKQFRKENLKKLQDIYYQTFADETAAEGYDVKLILPRDDFDNSCEYYYEFSLLTQVIFYQLCLTPPSITSKFLSSPELFDLNMLTDRTAMVVETFKTDQLCRDRITEAMDELIQHFRLAK